MTSTQIDTQTQGGLRGFLNKGGFWPLLLVVAVYFAIYLPAGKVAANLADRSYSEADPLSSVGAVFVQLTAALIVGSIVLIAFTTFMGWNAEIFGRQPIYRSRWMWLAPVVVLMPILMRVFGIDWGGPALSVILMMLATGALIGFSEELLYRGIAVKMLRSGGHREFSVAWVSSLLFGLSHSLNIFSGGAPRTVALTVAYTVGFGMLMYLSMRVIGFIAGGDGPARPDRPHDVPRQRRPAGQGGGGHQRSSSGCPPWPAGTSCSCSSQPRSSWGSSSGARWASPRRRRRRRLPDPPSIRFGQPGDVPALAEPASGTCAGGPRSSSPLSSRPGSGRARGGAATRRSARRSGWRSW